MKNLICRILGHKPEPGELKRSPYTVCTHSQDIHCKRCGVYLTYQKHYKDALTEPEFFRTPPPLA